MTANVKATWIDSSYVQKFFEEFPYPLVIMRRDGHILAANRCFSTTCDSTGMESSSIRHLIDSPGSRWMPVSMLQRDGSMAIMRAQALAVDSDDVLIVFSPQTEDPAAGEVGKLRQQLSQLEQLVATDHLTGAWNRAHLDRMIELELSRSNRYQQPLSLLLLDIDHFKNINDRYGHQTGDLVLQEIVRVTRDQIRKADLLFRWGGEEFVVIAPSSGYRSAAALAEKIRTAVALHNFPGTGKITVSLGVAEHLPDEKAVDFFHRVDSALYAAKNGGRDRVVIDRRGGSDEWARSRIHSLIRLEWLEAYECGNSTIDTQHRRLFELANRLIEAAFDADQGSPAVHTAFDELLAHVAKHFADEEAILRNMHYEKFELHQRAHAGLVARAGQLKSKLDAGEITLGEVIEFLANDVVARHMLSVDRDFFPLFETPAAATSDS